MRAPAALDRRARRRENNRHRATRHRHQREREAERATRRSRHAYMVLLQDRSRLLGLLGRSHQVAAQFAIGQERAAARQSVVMSSCRYRPTQGRQLDPTFANHSSVHSCHYPVPFEPDQSVLFGKGDLLRT